MTNHQQSNTAHTEPTQDAVELSIKTILEAAKQTRNNPIKLLAILRNLESLHQEIRDTLFQESLPDNRQALYLLLKDIEASGGWPYIYRTKLSELLERLAPDELENLLRNEKPPSSFL